jgi:hypothetical protein
VFTSLKKDKTMNRYFGGFLQGIGLCLALFPLALLSHSAFADDPGGIIGGPVCIHGSCTGCTPGVFYCGGTACADGVHPDNCKACNSCTPARGCKCEFRN